MTCIEVGLLPSGFVRGEIMLPILAGLLNSEGPWGDTMDSLAPGVVFCDGGGE